MELKIKTEGEFPELWMYGEIRGDSVNALKDALGTLPSASPLDLHLHTEGGVYTDGIAIHSMLSNRAGDVNVKVDGLAASAGSIIAMAGTNIEMASGAWMMIHEAHASFDNARSDELRQIADRIDAVNAQMRDIYSPRFLGEGDLGQLMRDEAWFSAEDAVAVGLADSVAESAAIAAHIDPEKFGYKNTPVILKAAKPGSLASRADALKLLDDSRIGEKEDASAS